MSEKFNILERILKEEAFLLALGCTPDFEYKLTNRYSLCFGLIVRIIPGDNWTRGNINQRNLYLVDKFEDKKATLLACVDKELLKEIFADAVFDDFAKAFGATKGLG